MKHYIIGQIETPAGNVEQVSTIMTNKDLFSTIKVRLSIGRMNYIVTPGLYAVGKPDENSDVYVSCNFKLSFDHLRCALHNINAWILVLDTKGINVWCAAGKGTFGTKGLVIGWLMAIPLLYFNFLGTNIFEIISWFLIIGGISSFMAMNFTGATTFTSLSGVQKEMKISLPIQITGTALGFTGWIITRFI